MITTSLRVWSAWFRFAGSRTYHRTGPDYVRRGLSLCGKDLTHTGYELIDGDSSAPNDRRFKRCAHCLRHLENNTHV